MNLIRTDSLNLNDLSVFTALSETQLLHFHEPEAGLFIAESPKIVRRALDAGYEPVSLLTEEGMAEKNEEKVFDRIGEHFPQVPVYQAPHETLIRITGYNLTGGLLAAMRRKPMPDPAEILPGKRRIALLEDVENPTNIGAIFRSAAALGIEAVLLAGGCADPLYRRAARVSMGGVFQVPWTRLTDRHGAKDVTERLRGYGFKTAAIVTMGDVIEHLYRPGDAAALIDDACMDRIRAYYEQYGAK